MRPKRDRGKVESRPRLCNRQNHLEDQPGQQSVYTAQQRQQAVPAVNRPAQPAMPLAAGPTDGQFAPAGRATRLRMAV